MGIKPIILEDCVGSSGGDECHEAGMLLLKRSIGKELGSVAEYAFKEFLVAKGLVE